jgi:cadmium resistance protein CadD (predicted permease)
MALLHGAVILFNLVPAAEYIHLEIRAVDVIVGATIYLKTAIDFAIFMGRLMSTNPGWKNRIAIEIGTAAGNALGTIIVIGLWVVFKNIDVLLAGMVFLASLVLFELAHGSLEHFVSLQGPHRLLSALLNPINRATKPFLSRVMPDLGEKLRGKEALPWKKLLIFSATVPFILGLDDFAGYVPLFTVINVYGFAIGVIGAHTMLNIALFLSPKRTIAAVKNEWISLLGTVAFIGLALWGIIETARILLHALGK